MGPGACALESVLHGRDVRGDTVVVSAGVCGALDPELVGGALVVPRAVQLLSGALLSVSPALQERVLTAAAAHGSVRAAHGSVLLSVDKVVSTPSLKRELWQRTGAVAVDMESGPILAAAAARGWPALVVRAVSDTADEALSPELASLVDARGRPRLARAAGLMLRRPDLLPQAWRIALASRRALHSVARVLVTLQQSFAQPPRDPDAVAR